MRRNPRFAYAMPEESASNLKHFALCFFFWAKAPCRRRAEVVSAFVLFRDALARSDRPSGHSNYCKRPRGRKIPSLFKEGRRIAHEKILCSLRHQACTASTHQKYVPAGTFQWVKCAPWIASHRVCLPACQQTPVTHLANLLGRRENRPYCTAKGQPHIWLAPLQ